MFPPVAIKMNNVVFELMRISQAISQSESPVEQSTIIVEAISAAMSVDVCSLYLRNTADEMVLVASHGLAAAAVRNVSLPPGKGLVGLVAASRHTLNITNAEEHPAYYYVPLTHEEHFHGFCGVPLVRAGEVIGVLTVMSRQSRQLSEEEEAFLVTLATQLALLVKPQQLLEINSTSTMQHLAGVRGAPGVGIGEALLCDSGGLSRVADAACENIEGELEKWRQLVASVQNDMSDDQQALGDSLSENIRAIFTAHRLLLTDSSLTQAVEDKIRGGNWLPGALRQVIQHFSGLFLAMDDPYMKARHEDIIHIGNKLYSAWQGGSQRTVSDTATIVLVGNQVSVSDMAQLPAGCLAGIVCYTGSALSHTAVLANAMGVPALMGVGVIKGIVDGTTLVVDGYHNQVIVNPINAVRDEFYKLVADDQQLYSQLGALRDELAVTTDGTPITLYTNTGLLADISPGLASGAQGVGLYRTEIPFMIHDGFPSEEEQMQIYRHVLTAYTGKPVYMRTLDIGGDKQLPYFPITHEDNPALGWRGIRFSLDNSPLLMTQIRAMIRAARGEDNLHILLPMVSSTAEIDAFNELLGDACDQLSAEGHVLKRPRVGVMMEVPAATSQLPFWKGKIDFISIGTNDLSQYLLALDRNNARVASRYDHVHPAVLHEIARIVAVARAHELPLSLCGEMASDPVAAVLLLGMGIRTMSMSAIRLPRIKWLIRSLSMQSAEALVSRAMAIDNPKTIRKIVNEELEAHGLGILVH
jgi:phosphotransferase system enzyme I (PtsI)/phosphotransferase system enzyme I (PtsP)